MKTVEIRTTDPEELLEQMGHLVGDMERRHYFDRHPELINAEQVKTICARVVQDVRVDTERAFELARSARFIADRLNDAASIALAARATANAYYCLGDADRSQEHYQEALDLFLSLGDDLSAAITRSSALHNLAYIGDWSQVQLWESEARRTFERLGDRSRLAILNHNFANVLARKSRWEEALTNFNAAYEEFQALGRAEDATFCLNNVASCYLEIHRPEKALEIYSLSREYCEQEGLSHQTMVVDFHLGYLYYLQAEYTESIRLFQTAKRAAKKYSDQLQEALCDQGLSEVYLELNLLKEADELSRLAYEGFDRLKMRYEAAQALTNSAVVASRCGEVEMAMVMLRRARKSFEQEENKLWPAQVDFYRAAVLCQAERFEEAGRFAEEALGTFDGAEWAGSRSVMCETLWATILLRSDRLHQGKAVCAQALNRLETLELPALEYQVLQVLGQIEEGLDAPAAALDAYERCGRWLEQMRGRLRGDDLKISFFGTKQEIFESLVYLTLRDTELEQRAERCLHYIEKSKSRILADVIAFREDHLPAKSELAESLVARARKQRDELNWFYRRLDTLVMGDGGESAQQDVKKLQEELRQREDALLETQRELSAHDMELSSIQSGAVFDLDTIRASIPEGAQIVEFFIARGRLLAAVIDQEHLHLLEPAAAGDARSLHRLLQFQLSRGAHGRHSEGVLRLIRKSTEAHLRDLYDLLIAPLEPYLTGDHLIIAPHGFLHYVPFHALTAPDGAPLIEKYSISYTPSGGVFHLCVTKDLQCEDRSLVMGVADELAPHILDEVRAVAETLPGSTLLEGEAADEDALRELGNGCRYLHVATHGIFRRDNPMFSAIQLGTSRLSLFDLYNLRLNAEMVVLSGCGTGLNAVLGADELLGLTRGVLYAGAKSVLVTLWDVHDASTADFMRLFYRHLGAGLPRAKALQRTMIEHRESYSQPYFWAPFVLIGDPGV